MTGPRPRILVVDDDLAIRAFLSEVLTEDGYEVQAAEHGEEALTVLRHTRISLILLDLMMPVMDGWEFRERQLADAALAEIPIIVMSADHKMPDAVASIGALAVLSKPFDMDRLLSTVREAVQRQASELDGPRPNHEAAGTSNGASK